MRIENITEKKLTTISYKELEETRMRIVQQWDKYFKDSKENKVGTLDREYLVEKYKLLVTERVKNRNVLIKTIHPIDQYIFDISMFKLSVPNLGEMIAVSDFCCLAGAFVKNPQEADDIEVVLKLSTEKRNEDLERELKESLTNTIKKEEGEEDRKIKFIYCAEGPDSSYIPLYDFVLKPKEKTEVKRIKKIVDFDIKKPYPNEHACRLRDPDEFQDKPWRRTERISDGKRYGIITGRLKGKITGTEQAYRYPINTWTEAQARVHCKDHDGILFESAKKNIAIKKPEETKDEISIPVSPECKVTATITISTEQGITALYCGEIKTIRTFIFDKKKKAWTMSSAKAWIKEHKEKVYKQLEESLKTFEYLIHHIAIEGDKEIVHHCHLYDHIGNLFEQSHLWIEKGKIYLDGNEIKEGHYHVIKGLEETQEVAWSEEEATAADIKPKRMMSGMTLKEKAKVW